MNRELTQDECRDQRTILKILERNKTEQWLGGGEYWLTVVKQIEAMQTTGTTDGEDLAELTDEDARERPWVMAKSYNENEWQGPYRFLLGPPVGNYYVVLSSNRTLLYFHQARRATENELKQAGITK